MLISQNIINEGIIIINNGNDMIRVPITPISTYNDEFTSTKFTSRTRNNTTPSPCTTNGPEVTPTIFRAPTSLNSSGNYANYPLVLPPLSVVRCNITYTHLEDILLPSGTIPISPPLAKKNNNQFKTSSDKHSKASTTSSFLQSNTNANNKISRLMPSRNRPTSLQIQQKISNTQNINDTLTTNNDNDDSSSISKEHIIVMEYFGKSLDLSIDKFNTLKFTRELFLNICKGVQFLHKNGIVVVSYKIIHSLKNIRAVTIDEEILNSEEISENITKLKRKLKKDTSVLSFELYRRIRKVTVSELPWNDPLTNQIISKDSDIICLLPDEL
ncbi:12394_t:CDS:2 [Entrophospora sp. SA101]|nr:12394_t:CDS:2 [Entrophospora sp. SA101]